jgi:hypothetical protein
MDSRILSSVNPNYDFMRDQYQTMVYFCVYPTILVTDNCNTRFKSINSITWTQVYNRNHAIQYDKPHHIKKSSRIFISTFEITCMHDQKGENKIHISENNTYSQGTSPTSIQSPSLSSYVSTYSEPWRRSIRRLSFRPSRP